MTAKIFVFKVILLLICGTTYLTEAKNDVKVFIAIKQDCSNCNLIAYVYKQVSDKYKTHLVFNNMSKKELQSYLKEVIILPDTVSHIASDSLMKVLEDFSTGLGAFVYAFKGKECVYAANLKSFDKKKMDKAISLSMVKYESVSIPDSVIFLNHANATANKKYYCLYQYE